MTIHQNLPTQLHVALEDELAPRDPYMVKSVVHASAILAAFHDNTEALTLKEIVTRCRLPKSMVFRLLYTMEHCGFVQKVGKNLYRVVPLHLAKDTAC